MEKNKIKLIGLNDKIDFENKGKLKYFLSAFFFFVVALWVKIKKIIRPKIKTNFYFFDGLCLPCRGIKDNSKNWRALDIIYNYKFNQGNRLSDFWLDIRNAQAVRNRLKIVKFLLEKNINELVARGQNIRICSIASGSAQGLIEIIALAKSRNIDIEYALIDFDPTAHEYAKKLAQLHGVGDLITCYLKKASYIQTLSTDFRPSIIEMVGFLEYRNDMQAIELINLIYKILPRGGIFITSQIKPNAENFFLQEVINWPMEYRSVENFQKIMEATSFSKELINFYWEKQKIHFVVEAKKS